MSTNKFQELATLSVELLEESEHEHPMSLPNDQCPQCWTRKMALDLMLYMWRPYEGTIAIAA